MFKHPTCGGKHETASEARACETEIRQQEATQAEEQAAERGYVRHLENLGYDEARAQEQHEADFMGRVIGPRDEDYGRETRGQREVRQGIQGRPVDRSQNLPADVQAQARRDAYGRPARVFQSAHNRPDLAKVTQDGMYRNPATGEVHKVQFPREAPGDVKRLYASLLVVDVEAVTGDDGEIITRGKRHWTYVGGASKVVRPEWRLSVDEAKALGALYGTCVYGHALTKEESIRKGIGPVCEEKYGMPV